MISQATEASEHPIEAGVAEPVNRQIRSPWWIYSLIGMTALAIIGMMSYSYYTSLRIITMYAPLIDAAMEIRLHATNAHLWFEEIMSGDTNESISIVWNYLDEADWYAQAMLTGGQNSEGVFVALEDAEMKADIQATQEKLRQFRQITRQRLTAQDSAGVGSELDQAYDLIFRDFVNQADSVESRLKELIAQDLQTFQLAQMIMMGISLLAFGGAGVAFYRFNRQQMADLLAIQQREGQLLKLRTINEDQIWLTSGQADLNDAMRGQQDETTLAKNIIRQLCQYLELPVGAVYIQQDDETLHLVASYAYRERKHLANRFQLGEGVVGQAALEKEPILLNQIPADYLKVFSGLGEAAPRAILVSPFLYEKQLMGVVELATLTEFTPNQRQFLDRVMENIAIAFHTAQSHHRMQELLEATQQQTEELRVQEEELRATNEELTTQAQSLRESETRLKENQVELEATNMQLAEQAAALEESSAALREKQAAVDQQNQELKTAQVALERKAAELALTSKYKSEFLANMSHELRTPLNSLLILSRMLADDNDQNLNQEQVEAAEIIFNAGNDLLTLINEILDLSKVEAGKLELQPEAVPLSELALTIKQQFIPIADKKKLDFQVNLTDDLPETICTDYQRVGQILKNLLSNAFKFTTAGQVCLTIARPELGQDLTRSGLHPPQSIAFQVADTGIGISADQQTIIFEAFQQADGSTSRKYGGTGLGLSICRELAAKLGGQINLHSTVGVGSIFTLYLPERLEAQPVTEELLEESIVPRMETLPAPVAVKPQPKIAPALSDDRDIIETTDRVLLAIEDDPHFAKILYKAAHQKEFKCLLAEDGETGLNLALTYQPTAIILDLKLPHMTGWEVLNRLKDNAETRHIPVHIMSVDDETLEAYRKGAIGYLTKPVSQTDLETAFQKIEKFTSNRIKSLLLVEDDAGLRQGIAKLLGGADVEIIEASSGQAAVTALQNQPYDCLILDLQLPDMSGFELLNRINDDSAIAKCPIIVYTGKALTKEENKQLTRYADSVIIKGVKSPERLLDETALFLHRVVADMPTDKQQTIKQLYDADTLLTGKTILVVDDDMRNSFALSKLLSDKGVQVEIAENGEEALKALTEHPEIDLVLMDIMMPVMDGYEAMKRIRGQRQFRDLPILALTAKAMKGDREKCIDAGANDYLSKPLDVERLFSMLRVWLYE